MPRPPRRTRAVSTRAAAVATATSTTSGEHALDKDTTTGAEKQTPAASESSNNGRRRSRRSGAASQAPDRTSSDASVASNRELKRRTSIRQTATTTSARMAETTAAMAPRQTRGPDASGLDIMDDTFADIDTNFGDHDLGELDDDLDAFDGLDGLHSSPVAAGETVAGSANASHAADSTSSTFNVGLFRRGRPRQSSIHSRDDVPIRPSSRSGAATPSFGSTLNLGTFKRRAREPSILGRRRDTSRHKSRDRDTEASGSEMDTALYTSDAESSSMATRRRAERTSRASVASRAAQVAPSAQHVADSSMSSVSNTTSMLVMSRTRTRAAKRKSEEGQREGELPKRRAVEEAAAPSLPPSETGVLQSVEMSLSPPLSSPPRQSSPPTSDADRRRRYATPGGPDDEVMAPPLSSGSSSASPTIWPSLKGLSNAGRRGRVNDADVVPMVPLSRQTPELVDDDDASDISSPPSLTHSPNYRTARPKAKGKAANTRNATHANKNMAPLTTAALAALLPQRRRRGRRGGNSDDASDADDGDNELERSALLSEDDDELAHGPQRSVLRRGRSAARTPATMPAPAALRSASKAAAGTRVSATKASTGKSKRTYGSRSFSDKENQDSTITDLDADDSTFSPLPDDAFGDETTTEVLPTTATGKARYFGEELENASKKFKEVDRWALEFEIVSRESSPIGAR
ncbi:uncharacterized protein SPSK_07189 [Sporothrix schenckii 1099-18]|uniref:Uncharacterized protein n=2 Tax=Sporothrix schenckii TaxID=29908 RepID=U7Q3B5_SPOS1|nr:uncharacterized protein SPSK_07189 [Sporothrix schenckii 1099-18]ERT01485.1 hypothetical protein HMPREF1624_02735 [Sporothrix schenckii ATCC 58251]KJR88680.1 hypothetical protein SPSK_07189 [Sporothrix schenckii 1099-18]